MFASSTAALYPASAISTTIPQSDLERSPSSSPSPAAPHKKKLYASAVIAAGGKFDNHIPGQWPRRLRIVVCATKASGSMIRFGSLDGKGLVATTKNGVEQRFLHKFATVLDSQMNHETRAALALFLKRIGWSLAGELVVRDLGEHGSVPQVDHFIIHGGTKLDGSPVTPLDLIQMHRTLKWTLNDSLRGVYFPMFIFFRALDGGLIDGAAIDAAVAAVNVLPLWGERASVKARIEVLRSVAKSHGVVSSVHRTYNLEKLDSARILEGWVAWQVTDLQRWPAFLESFNADGKFKLNRVERLGIDCTPAGFAPPPYSSSSSFSSFFGASANLTQFRPTVEKSSSSSSLSSSSGVEEPSSLLSAPVSTAGITVQVASGARSGIHPFRCRCGGCDDDMRTDSGMPGLVRSLLAVGAEQRKPAPFPAVPALPQNFGPSKHYTIQEALLLIAEGDMVLRPLLFDLVRFSESRFGKKDVSKFNSFSINIASNPDGVCVLSITVRSDEVWAAYARYREEDYVGRARAMPLSRGMSFVLTEDSAAAMSPEDEYPVLQEQRTKLKLANYVLRTMLLRGWIHQQQVGMANGQPCDVDSLFKDALGQMRRWRVVEPERRLEVLTQVHIVAAFMAAFGGRGRDTIFHVTDASYLEILDVMIPRAVALATDEGLRTQLANGGMQDQLLHRATSWKDDAAVLDPCTVAALRELTPYTFFALIIAGKTLWARNIEHGFSVPGAQPVEGITRGAFFRELQNAKLAEEVKTELLPLAAIVTKYGMSSFVRQHMLRLRPLTLVLLAAVPGTGKSTCVGRLAELLGSDRTVVLSSDQAGGRGVSLAELLEAKPFDEGVEFVIVDRCSASNVDTVRRALWTVLPRYDLHVRLLVPTSFETVEIDGNDWNLPFSVNELATYLGSVLVRTQHVGKVEGPKGFSIAASHVVSTARYYGSIEEEALKSWGPLVASYGHGYYYTLVDEPPKIPDSLYVATLLALGLELSKAMRKLAAKFPPKQPTVEAAASSDSAPLVVAAAVKKGGAKKGGAAAQTTVSDAAMLRKLALGFALAYDNYTYDMEELLVNEPDDAKFLANWEQWLAVKVAPLAAEYNLSARRSVEDVARQMLDGVMNQSPIVDLVSTEMLHIPVVPNTFALMYNALTVDFIISLHRDGLEIFPSGRMHTTLHVTNFFSDLSGLERHIQRAVAGEEEYDIEFESLAVSTDSMVIHAEGNRHITVICAGANKDSCVGTRPIMDLDWSGDGRVVACVPL